MLKKTNKILLITPINPQLTKDKPLPRYQIQNYWLKALKSLKYQVIIFGLEKKQLKITNYFKLNKVIKNYQPDQIFFSAGIDKLYSIKNTIFFCGVPLTKISNSERKIGVKAKLIIVNDPKHLKQWQKITKTKIINLPFSAVDPDFFKPTKSKKKYNFVFIGTLFKNRQLQLIKLINQDLDLKIWGWIPPSIILNPALKSNYQGEVWGRQVAKIYQQSKIALNLVPDHMIDGGNLRTFEIPACKTLQFIDKINPNYYQKDKEVIVFKSPEDLKNKLEFYLSHPKKRKKIIQ
ncbi:MAG: glycosyltransferase, partial [Patescibacteria group bacterium]|nr:glycosyltransferase [Patescibacteria group bacterium]